VHYYSLKATIILYRPYHPSPQGRRNEFEGGEGGRSMHWKVLCVGGGVNTVKTLKFEKGGGA